MARARRKVVIALVGIPRIHTRTHAGTRARNAGNAKSHARTPRMHARTRALGS